VIVTFTVGGLDNDVDSSICSSVPGGSIVGTIPAVRPAETVVDPRFACVEIHRHLEHEKAVRGAADPEQTSRGGSDERPGHAVCRR